MSPVEDDAAWGKDSTSTISIMQRPKPNKVPVRESWDDEDDDDDEPVSDSKSIWEQEDARTPMPQIQLSTTATASGISLPPPAAFKEPLRILKRPGNEVKLPPTTPPPNSQTAKTLQERETQYRAARERIFGDKDAGSSSLQNLSEGRHVTMICDPISSPTSNQSNNFPQRKDSSPTLPRPERHASN